MRYRPLGQAGCLVSEIGLGCASWWGKPAFDEARAARLVHTALDHGVTFFDTGASYSAGHAEPRLGRALAGRDLDGVVIATKAGTYYDGRRIVRDFSPEAIEASVLRSLDNLGLERLALLQLHGPGVADLTQSLLEKLTDLKVRGLVGALGVNSFHPQVIEHATALDVFDVLMVDYNVLRPERETLIDQAVARGKGVLAGMPLAMGHTARQVLKLRAPQDIWYALRALKHHRADVKQGARFGFLNSLPDMTGAQAALAYVLDNPKVACAVVGTTRPAHLLENIAASGKVLPGEVMARLRRVQQAR